MTDLIVGDLAIRRQVGSGCINPRDQCSIDSTFQTPELLPIVIRPGESVLLATKEPVEIPLGCIGHICLRSTFARLGLLAPPTVADPGFHGTLTMEVMNASQTSIVVEPEVAVWSLHFLAAFDISRRYEGRYQGQEGITTPRALK